MTKYCHWYDFYVHVPDSDKCRWRPGLSSFHTFTAAGSSLSLDEAVMVPVEDIVLSCVGEVSGELIRRIGMRLT